MAINLLKTFKTTYYKFLIVLITAIIKRLRLLTWLRLEVNLLNETSPADEPTT